VFEHSRNALILSVFLSELFQPLGGEDVRRLVFVRRSGEDIKPSLIGKGAAVGTAEGLESDGGSNIFRGVSAPSTERLRPLWMLEDYGAG
jgi:hypothetical protein